MTKPKEAMGNKLRNIFNINAGMKKTPTKSIEQNSESNF